ncbi:MAG: hypothetical protein HY904_00750 [Deltaproteobacteria bacterium]|nr:hypothetical protein [Deltaproteobacteria bacterium]
MRDNRVSLLLATMAVSAILAGCPTPEGGPFCTRGTKDCACAAGDVPCQGDLFCAAGLCREPLCEPGSLDCACHGNSTCNQDSDGTWLVCDSGLCRRASCPQGALGCGCFAGATCNEGLFCSSEGGPARCVSAACAVGDQGCGCKPDRTCNGDLLCNGQVCEQATCTAGTDACACRPDYSCDTGLSCQAGLCAPTTCTTGTQGCGCLADNTCTGTGLVCSAGGICQPAGCTAGDENCECLAGGSCSTTPDGAQLECVSGTCQRPACTQGTDGCGCRTGGACDANLACVLGVCRSASLPIEDLVPPATPKCYTPCRSGMTDGTGTYRVCTSEGLMEGCLEGQQCTGGSCVPAGGSPRTCQTDLQCPDFQTCIAGNCYSNCNYDSDCSGDHKCYRRVCRTPCDSGTADRLDTCGADRHCSMVDGVHGYCVSTPAPTGDAARTAEGTLVAKPAALAFSNTSTTATFTVMNPSSRLVTVTLRKVEHGEYTANGRSVITTNPLHWVTMGAGTPTQVQSLNVNVEPGGSVDITVAGTANPALSRWDGVLEVTADHLGPSRINLDYASRPDGRWSGKAYFFAAFADGARDNGTLAVDEWMRERNNTARLDAVGNAFLQRWDAFKRGVLSYDEFQAVLTATQTASWKFSNVMQQCRTQPNSRRACYLYRSGAGVIEYSSDVNDYAIPTGVSELPVSMNLRSPDPVNQPTLMNGRIVTDESMQYAGDPAVSLAFVNAPTQCTTTAGGTCLVPIQSFAATIAVGGRYLTTDIDSDCSQAAPGTFELTRTPWLVPGFLEGTTLEESTGLRYRWECRDKLLPYGTDQGPLNRSFAQSNPVPDGRSRMRTLELLDGALIQGDSLFVIFREKFDSFLGGSDGTINAYGYMVLSRAAADLPVDAYAGSTPTDTRTVPDVLNVSCSDELLHGDTRPGRVHPGILLPAEALSPANALTVATAIILGQTPAGASAQLIDAGSTEKVHYYCEDTGLFDGGERDNAAAGFQKVACPIGSRVTYFTLQAITDLSGEACQKDGTCQETLNRWRSNQTHGIRVEPVWRCANSNEVYCDTDRMNPRNGKVFYAAGENEAVFVPIRAQINDAFRYKTRFRNRTTGQNVGFAPATCVPNSNAIPYCYDPPAIEDIRARVDCAIHLYSTPALSAALDAATRGMLLNYLDENFSFTTTMVDGRPITHDGFERLFAELLIMQGDEAYTRAFMSRFDLAGSQLVGFEGSRFEPDGINLSGAAGFEMYNLYLATQYYQTALDRFYRLGTELVALLEQLGSASGLKIVDAYFGRLIRASTQKSRAWSEVARHYQNFNQPELARNVVRRAYTATYLESVILSRMMLRVIAFADPADRDQIVRTAELAQLSYRAALLDMRDVFKGITDDVNFFGMAPDFIPFPALDTGDTNAFRKMYTAAQLKMQTAAEKEGQALQSNRSFETDAAAFQSELTRVRNNYENQLADICGTFQAADGVVYPAIPKYAFLSEPTRLMGDPCGLVGNGKLHEGMANLEIQGLNFDSVQTSHRSLLAEVEIERQRVNAQCGLTMTLADYDYEVAGRVGDMQDAITTSRNVISTAQRLASKAATVAGLTKCSIIAGVAVGGDCVTAGVAAVAFGVVAVAAEAAATVNEFIIQAKENEIAEIQRGAARWRTAQQCQVALVDSDARVKTMLLRMEEINLEALRANYQTRLAISGIQALRHQATRLIAEQEETEQLTINVEAARNDPNVRIYKNDAILTADRTFDAAIRDAYKATKVYEYYTSQSYARLNNLFLVRMVANGDISLEQYMAELSDAFTAFEEQFGVPDVRVQVLSLRDDVLAIPRLDSTGRALSQSERIAQLRARLTDVKLLDAKGYLSIPFATQVETLSPLTRNHKLHYVESELIGSDVGDNVGRVYLRQKGTGMVRPVEGSSLYYAFPERTAVLNPLFNGQRVFGGEVYRSNRLRDRPLVNTAWELVLNQKDEQANQDINLQSLTDIRLYLYYTDFTEL